MDCGSCKEIITVEKIVYRDKQQTIGPQSEESSPSNEALDNTFSHILDIVSNSQIVIIFIMLIVFISTAAYIIKRKSKKVYDDSFIK